LWKKGQIKSGPQLYVILVSGITFVKREYEICKFPLNNLFISHFSLFAGLARFIGVRKVKGWKKSKVVGLSVR